MGANLVCQKLVQNLAYRLFLSQNFVQIFMSKTGANISIYMTFESKFGANLC